MTSKELYEFEQWLLLQYSANNTVPFYVIAQALKVLRNNVQANPT